MIIMHLLRCSEMQTKKKISLKILNKKPVHCAPNEFSWKRFSVRDRSYVQRFVQNDEKKKSTAAAAAVSNMNKVVAVLSTTVSTHSMHSTRFKKETTHHQHRCVWTRLRLHMFCSHNSPCVRCAAAYAQRPYTSRILNSFTSTLSTFHSLSHSPDCCSAVWSDKNISTAVFHFTDTIFETE